MVIHKLKNNLIFIIFFNIKNNFNKTLNCKKKLKLYLSKNKGLLNKVNCNLDINPATSKFVMS